MSKIVKTISNALNEKLIQVSIVGTILFFILANTQTFKTVQNLLENVFKFVGVKVQLKGNQFVAFHSIVYGVLLYLSSRYLIKPVVKLLK